MYKEFYKFNINSDFIYENDLGKKWLFEYCLFDEEDVSTKDEFLIILIKNMFQLSGIYIFNLEIENNELSVEKIENIPVIAYTNVIRNALIIAINIFNNVSKDIILKKMMTDIIIPVSKITNAVKTDLYVLKAANKKNIPINHISSGIFQLGWGSNSIYLNKTGTENDSHFGVILAQNKFATASLFNKAGLPSPKHILTNSTNNLEEYIKHIQYPIVVKPIDLDRGEGITMNISSIDKLEKAIIYALNKSNQKAVLIEEQVPGVCHRLFIANGKLLYAAKRLPRSVRGNGLSTIRDLLFIDFKKNEQLPPWKREPFILPDELTLSFLREQGLSFEHIPKKGQVINTRDIESTEWSGEFEDITNIVHPENIKIALKAAKLIKLNTVGVDIITDNISKPWYETKAIINEVNFMPMLGASEISKNYIDGFLSEFIKDDGRIPITYVKLWKAGLSKLRSSKNNEVYLIGYNSTINKNEEKVFFKFNNLDDRLNALLKDNSVEEIIIVKN